MEQNLLILVLALLVDRIVGDPDWLWRRIPHPIVLFGGAIGFFDKILNRETDPPEKRRLAGVVVLAALILLSLAIGYGLSAGLGALGLPGRAVEICIVSVFLAQRSLADHVSAVATAMRQEGLEGGRLAVSRIVGRDPDSLDAPGVCRAAVESLAENFADGVVAPAFWFVVLGLPGLLAYKLINTADSMIGHKSDRHRDFGWAAARFDDLVNWPAARISALLISGAAWFRFGAHEAGRSLDVAGRDAGLHRSPNAGWPECAMAGALGLSLAGERHYAGVMVREPRMNAAGRFDVTASDVQCAVRLFNSACTALVLTVICLLVTVSIFGG